MIRVVFTGSESTGKSTLAAEVAAYYRVEVVPEFVRTFAEEKGAPIEFSDHGLIARGQMALEDEYIARRRRPAPPAHPALPAPPAPPALPAPPAHPALPAPPCLFVPDTRLLRPVVFCRQYFGPWSPCW